MAAKKTPSFEDRLRRLQEVVAALENGELPLEDSEGLEPFDEKKLDEEGE